MLSKQVHEINLFVKKANFFLIVIEVQYNINLIDAMSWTDLK